jgi:RNA polymerase sigma-70 factor (ECF subfamily)
MPDWETLIDSAGPASLLVIIDGRMSAALRRTTTPEDILQDALLHAWRDRDKFQWRGLRAFRSWLLSIIDHRIQYAADQLSAQKRGGGAAPVSLAAGNSPFGGTTAAEQRIPAGSTTPSRAAIFREQAAAMQAALESLPPEQREVVRLRLFEQLTLEEIAQRLDVTVPAVRHRFGRGAEHYQRELRSQLTSRSLPLPEFTAATDQKASP